MASKEYFEEKSKMYYESYVNNKSTRHVRGIIINDMGQILLLHFKKRNGYSIPGGTAEENESIKDTVLREVLEETGISNMECVSISGDINVPFDINSHYIPANEKKHEDGHYHHDFRYLFIINRLEDITIDYNESNDYKWVSVSSLLDDGNFGLSIKKIVSLIRNKKKIMNK